jgi:predicted enzyme related to lactoylglutathione lyase
MMSRNLVFTRTPVSIDIHMGSPIMPTVTSYEHGQFNWVDLMSPDTEAAKKFYSTVFDWTPEDRPTAMGIPYTIFKLGDDEICGMGPLPPDMQEQGIPSSWNSYINVDDLESAADKVQSLGGTIFMPAMKVMDAGWMVGIMDPTGGRVFLWKKNEHVGATRINDPGCLCWNELATRDIEKAREFYGALFDWQFEDNPSATSKYYIVHNKGIMNGGIMQMNEQWPEGVPPHWGIYFAVENAEEACKRLTDSGGEVYAAPFEIPIGKIAVVSDPFKAVFHFFEFGDHASSESS